MRTTRCHYERGTQRQTVNHRDCYYVFLCGLFFIIIIIIVFRRLCRRSRSRTHRCECVYARQSNNVFIMYAVGRETRCWLTIFREPILSSDVLLLRVRATTTRTFSRPWTVSLRRFTTAFGPKTLRTCETRRKKVALLVPRTIADRTGSDRSLVNVHRVCGVVVSRRFPNDNVHSAVIDYWKRPNVLRCPDAYRLSNHRVHEMYTLLALRNDGRTIFQLAYVARVKFYRRPFWFRMFCGTIKCLCLVLQSCIARAPEGAISLRSMFSDTANHHGNRFYPRNPLPTNRIIEIF